MLPRLLALVVALCAALPVQGWARVIEACHGPDRCACRRDEQPSETPLARRVDCCEAPCASATPPAPATVPRGDAFVALANERVLFALAPAPSTELVAAAPSARTRGPPPRRFAVIEHWLL